MPLNINIQLLAWSNARQLVGNEHPYIIITEICTNIWWKDIKLSTGHENTNLITLLSRISVFMFAKIAAKALSITGVSSLSETYYSQRLIDQSLEYTDSNYHQYLTSGSNGGKYYLPEETIISPCWTLMRRHPQINSLPVNLLCSSFASIYILPVNTRFRWQRSSWNWQG